MAANPFQEFRPAIRAGYFHTVMHEAKTHAFVRQIAQHLFVITLDGGMSATAVRINHNRVSALQSACGFRPAVRVNDRGDPGHGVETLLQQQ